MYVVTYDNKYLWSVVVLTVLPLTLSAEDKLKIQQKALKSRRYIQLLAQITVSWMYQIK